MQIQLINIQKIPFIIQSFQQKNFHMKFLHKFFLQFCDVTKLKISQNCQFPKLPISKIAIFQNCNFPKLAKLQNCNFQNWQFWKSQFWFILKIAQFSFYFRTLIFLEIRFLENIFIEWKLLVNKLNLLWFSK